MENDQEIKLTEVGAELSAPVWWRRDWLLGLLLVAVTVIAYATVRHAGFIWDDDKYVTANPLLTAPDGLRRIWFSLDSPSQYFPLTYTSFYFERALWGLNPAGYHLINVLLHAANALLVWRVLARLRVPGAWLAAAIFALHPVQVGTVAWIAERKNVLMGFFFLLTLYAWFEFIDDRRKRSWRYYILALGFCGLALCAKTTACTLPAALLLILWLEKKPINRLRLVQVAPFVAMSIGMGLLTMWWERYHQGTQGKLFSIGPMERILIASRALWFYAGKLLWPVNLSFSYPRWTIAATDPFAYSWVLATAALGVVIWRVRRWTGRSVEVAALFFAATLGPMLGFIMLYTFLYSFVSDHYQYLACIGPIALAAAGMKIGLDRIAAGKRFLEPALCAALLLVLGGMTWRQCGMYANSETLWQTTLRQNPNSWMVENNFGCSLLQKGKPDEAIAHFKKALAIKPDVAESYYNLGNAFDQKGNSDEAAANYQKALEIEPDYAEAHNSLGNILLKNGKADEAIARFQQALQYMPGLASAHFSLGQALAQKGSLTEATAQYQEALQSKPDYVEAYNNLGLALFRQGKPDDATVQFQKALEINPSEADAGNNLGNAFLHAGKVDEAIHCFQNVLHTHPDNVEAHDNLGLALRRKGKLDEAITQYQRALELKPSDAKAHVNLAVAFLQKGRVGEAMGHYQDALKLEPNDPRIQNVLAWLMATCQDASLRNGRKAVELSRQANALAGGENPIFLQTLAAALAETGQYSEAVETAQHALRLAEAQSHGELAGQLRAQLKLYQAGSPFHQ